MLFFLPFSVHFWFLWLRFFFIFLLSFINHLRLLRIFHFWCFPNFKQPIFSASIYHSRSIFSNVNAPNHLLAMPSNQPYSPTMGNLPSGHPTSYRIPSPGIFER
ncbi:hypothetical protein EV426DRAFT_582181 [Tirmania nivea]|nr:hypothetical protein EV426DRAFT_582181 [Tirmania nivea]